MYFSGTLMATISFQGFSRRKRGEYTLSFTQIKKLIVDALRKGHCILFYTLTHRKRCVSVIFLLLPLDICACFFVIVARSLAVEKFSTFFVGVVDNSEQLFWLFKRTLPVRSLFLSSNGVQTLNRE